jgi:hypothetical protein
MRPSPIRGAALLVAAGLTAAGLVGCTGSQSSDGSGAQEPAPTSASGKQDPDSSGAAEPAQTSATDKQDPPSTGATAVPTEVPNDTALRKNVQLSSCKRITGGWGASGTATNPGTTSVDYTITIFFTTSKATVVSTGATHITVDPGDTQTWTVQRKFIAQPKTLCVLRGVG